MIGTLHCRCSPTRHKRASVRRREIGSSLVEMAFIFILLVVVLLGIMGFGHALYAYHFVNHAAKEAARWAAVNGSLCNTDSTCTAPAQASDVSTYVQNLVPPGIEAANVTTTSCGVGGGTACASSTPTICSSAITTGTGSTVGPTPNYPGCTVAVTVSYPFNFILPLLPTPGTTAPCTQAGICMSSTSEMVIVH